jgi:uncharacterized membrane protein
MATVSISTDLIEDKVLLHSLYALLAAYPFLGIPPALALVINIVQMFDKKASASDLMSVHLKWQRNSSLIALLLAVIGYNLSSAWLTAVFCIGGGIWFTYRILRGWLALQESEIV